MGKKKAAANVGGKAPAKNADAVSIHDANGFVRTYSRAQHGEDFRELADEFAGKQEGRKVVAAE